MGEQAKLWWEYDGVQFSVFTRETATVNKVPLINIYT